jgi:hypothetical protein
VILITLRRDVSDQTWSGHDLCEGRSRAFANRVEQKAQGYPVQAMMRLIGHAEKRKDMAQAGCWILRDGAVKLLTYVLIEAPKGSVRSTICPARE